MNSEDSDSAHTRVRPRHRSFREEIQMDPFLFSEESFSRVGPVSSSNNSFTMFPDSAWTPTSRAGSTTSSPVALSSSSTPSRGTYADSHQSVKNRESWTLVEHSDPLDESFSSSTKVRWADQTQQSLLTDSPATAFSPTSMTSPSLLHHSSVSISSDYSRSEHRKPYDSTVSQSPNTSNIGSSPHASKISSKPRRSKSPTEGSFQESSMAFTQWSTTSSPLFQDNPTHRHRPRSAPLSRNADSDSGNRADGSMIPSRPTSVFSSHANGSSSDNEHLWSDASTSDACDSALLMEDRFRTEETEEHFRNGWIGIIREIHELDDLYRRLEHRSEEMKLLLERSDKRRIEGILGEFPTMKRKVRRGGKHMTENMTYHLCLDEEIKASVSHGIEECNQSDIELFQKEETLLRGKKHTRVDQSTKALFRNLVDLEQHALMQVEQIFSRMKESNQRNLSYMNIFRDRFGAGDASKSMHKRSQSPPAIREIKGSLRSSLQEKESQLPSVLRVESMNDHVRIEKNLRKSTIIATVDGFSRPIELPNDMDTAFVEGGLQLHEEGVQDTTGKFEIQVYQVFQGYRQQIETLLADAPLFLLDSDAKVEYFREELIKQRHLLLLFHSMMEDANTKLRTMKMDLLRAEGAAHRRTELLEDIRGSVLKDLVQALEQVQKMSGGSIARSDEIETLKHIVSIIDWDALAGEDGGGIPVSTYESLRVELDTEKKKVQNLQQQLEGVEAQPMGSNSFLSTPSSRQGVRMHRSGSNSQRVAQLEVLQLQNKVRDLESEILKYQNINDQLKKTLEHKQTISDREIDTRIKEEVERRELEWERIRSELDLEIETLRKELDRELRLREEQEKGIAERQSLEITILREQISDMQAQASDHFRAVQDLKEKATRTKLDLQKTEDQREDLSREIQMLREEKISMQRALEEMKLNGTVMDQTLLDRISELEANLVEEKIKVDKLSKELSSVSVSTTIATVTVPADEENNFDLKNTVSSVSLRSEDSISLDDDSMDSNAVEAVPLVSLEATAAEKLFSGEQSEKISRLEKANTILRRLIREMDPSSEFDQNTNQATEQRNEVEKCWNLQNGIRDLECIEYEAAVLITNQLQSALRFDLPNSNTLSSRKEVSSKDTDMKISSQHKSPHTSKVDLSSHTTQGKKKMTISKALIDINRNIDFNKLKTRLLELEDKIFSFAEKSEIPLHAMLSNDSFISGLLDKMKTSTAADPEDDRKKDLQRKGSSKQMLHDEAAHCRALMFRARYVASCAHLCASPALSALESILNDRFMYWNSILSVCPGEGEALEDEMREHLQRSLQYPTPKNINMNEIEISSREKHSQSVAENPTLDQTLERDTQAHISMSLSLSSLSNLTEEDESQIEHPKIEDESVEEQLIDKQRSLLVDDSGHSLEMNTATHEKLVPLPSSLSSKDSRDLTLLKTTPSSLQESRAASSKNFKSSISRSKIHDSKSSIIDSDKIRARALAEEINSKLLDTSEELSDMLLRSGHRIQSYRMSRTHSDSGMTRPSDHGTLSSPDLSSSSFRISPISSTQDNVVYSRDESKRIGLVERTRQQLKTSSRESPTFQPILDKFEPLSSSSPYRSCILYDSSTGLRIPVEIPTPQFLQFYSQAGLFGPRMAQNLYEEQKDKLASAFESVDDEFREYLQDSKKSSSEDDNAINHVDERYLHERTKPPSTSLHPVVRINSGSFLPENSTDVHILDQLEQKISKFSSQVDSVYSESNIIRDESPIEQKRSPASLRMRFQPPEDPYIVQKRKELEADSRARILRVGLMHPSSDFSSPTNSTIDGGSHSLFVGVNHHEKLEGSLDLHESQQLRDISPLDKLSTRVEEIPFKISVVKDLNVIDLYEKNDGMRYTKNEVIKQRRPLSGREGRSRDRLHRSSLVNRQRPVSAHRTVSPYSSAKRFEKRPSSAKPLQVRGMQSPYTSISHSHDSIYPSTEAPNRFNGEDQSIVGSSYATDLLDWDHSKSPPPREEYSSTIPSLPDHRVGRTFHAKRQGQLHSLRLRGSAGGSQNAPQWKSSVLLHYLPGGDKTS